MSPVGRPKADKPKDIRYSIRLDAETELKLQGYCAEHNITKGEAIRQGIHLLLQQKKQRFDSLATSTATIYTRGFPSDKYIISDVETSFKNQFLKGDFYLWQELRTCWKKQNL